MKTAALLLVVLVCGGVAMGDDVPSEVQEVLLRLKSSLVERLSNLEGEHADMASRLSASETKMEEFQTRLSQSEKLQQKHIADQSATCQPKTDTNLNLENNKLQDALTLENDALTPDNDRLKADNKNPMREKRQTADKRCPSGWTKFGGSCYYLTTEYKTWLEGRQECLSQGADLVVINSAQEQVFIRGLSPGAPTGTAIGLKWTGVYWAWVDGTPLTTQYWGNRWPQVRAGWDCGVYSHYEVPGTWFHSLCSAKRFAICEK